MIYIRLSLYLFVILLFIDNSYCFNHTKKSIKYVNYKKNGLLNAPNQFFKLKNRIFSRKLNDEHIIALKDNFIENDKNIKGIKCYRNEKYIKTYSGIHFETNQKIFCKYVLIPYVNKFYAIAEVESLLLTLDKVNNDDNGVHDHNILETFTYDQNYFKNSNVDFYTLTLYTKPIEVPGKRELLSKLLQKYDTDNSITTLEGGYTFLPTYRIQEMSCKLFNFLFNTLRYVKHSHVFFSDNIIIKKDKYKFMTVKLKGFGFIERMKFMDNYNIYSYPDILSLHTFNRLETYEINELLHQLKYLPPEDIKKTIELITKNNCENKFNFMKKRFLNTIGSTIIPRNLMINTRAMDLWSIGILIHLMATNEYPDIYKNNNYNDNNDIEVNIHADIKDTDIGNLINSLLQVNPENRLGFSIDGLNAIKKHPFFNDFIW